MLNETNILSSLLDIAVQPEPSFQVAHLEPSAGERFDYALQSQVDSRQNEAPPAASQSFEARERPEHSGDQTPVLRDEPALPPHAENQHSDSRPVTPDPERQGTTPLHDGETHPHSDEPRSKAPINPFALPLERLEQALNATNEALGLIDNVNQTATDVLAGLFDSQDFNLTETHGLNAEGSLSIDALNAEGSLSIDALKEFLAGLNIDSETIDQLLEALNNRDVAGIQSILNALLGLLRPSNQVAQAPGAEIVAEVAGNRLNLPEQRALNLLVRAGLTQEEAQQVIQQVRAGNTPQPATENSTQPAKTALDAIASKPNSENSNGSGNLQNGGSNGSAKNSSQGPRHVTGLAAERLDTLASLVAPDKPGAERLDTLASLMASNKPSNSGNAQTNPLIAKLSASPLLNLNASGQPAQGVLSEGAQAPAAVTDAAAKGVEFVKPAVTETYNGRASMDKPITAQIIEKFTLRGFGNQREVHIKLDPPSLGTVRMNVSTSGETVRATIIAENHVVKSVIENNLSQLKDSITHQGIKIDSFNVLVGGNASHSAEGHQSVLDYLEQLGHKGSMAQEPPEEIVALHRPIFLNENQSFSIFA